MEKPRILLVSHPVQGHINPSLQVAKRLIRAGARVTFTTSRFAIRRMTDNSSLVDLEGLQYATYSDGYDDGFKPGEEDVSVIRRCGSQTLKELIQTKIVEGCSFKCVMYSIIIPWVATVARHFNLQSTLLWNQATSVLGIYYYYFNGYGDIIRNIYNDDNHEPLPLINLPGLPPLAKRDLPSFLNPSNTITHALPLFKEHFEILDEETCKVPKVLVNTFDGLELEILKAVDKYNLVGIGPLIPSVFLDGKDPSDTSFGGDLFQGSKDNYYIQWLNSKLKSSVVYISFGSIFTFSKPQMEEIARALLDTDRPFLWVIRTNRKKEEEDNYKLSCKEELEKQGMIVPWCSQVEVLSHPSIGCYFTHCGWNSTFESLASGVPVVAFPQWSDQGTNAKLVQDLWKTGVRVNVKEDGILEADELKRCLELVMGCEERGEEMRRNAKKWRDLAREAIKDGGSSDNNVKTFLDEIRN